jgi:nitrate reductase NapE component|tara:strand:- start:783 stop:884 length:102 start_codon:yes stop_codon:yes gene_type:complete
MLEFLVVNLIYFGILSIAVVYGILLILMEMNEK